MPSRRSASRASAANEDTADSPQDTADGPVAPTRPPSPSHYGEVPTLERSPLTRSAQRTADRRVPVHQVPRSRTERVPHRAQGADRPRRHGIRRARAGTAYRVRPGHRRGDPRPGRGRPDRHRHHLVLERDTAPRPAVGPPLRLGPGPPRRRRQRPAARAGRTGPRRRAHRHARPRPLGGRAHRRHHRHRLLRTGRRGRPGRCSRPAQRAVRGAGHRHRRPGPPRLHLHPRPRPDPLPCRTGRTAHPRRALPQCRKVYVPPRGACPTCGVPTDEQVEVGPAGTVTTFCVVNIKAKNLDIEVPYVYGHIALDGAGLALHGRIAGIPYDQVRMGLRVEPVWTEGGRYPDHYRPTGEPDAAYDTYKELL